MRHSLQWRLALSLGIALAAGILASGYVLLKFHSYEDRALAVLTGDQKSVLLSHLIEARVKAAQELVETSVGSESASEAFRERIQAILDDVKALAKDHSSPSIEDAKRVLSSVLAGKLSARGEGAVATGEDLFSYYRNIETTAFNLYRLAWNNKWMTVARTMGVVLNGLHNMPYQAGLDAAGAVVPRIAQLTAVITGSAIPQPSKIMLFGQLSALKEAALRYAEAFERAESVKKERGEQLRILSSILKKYGDVQARTVTQFNNVAHIDFLKGLMAFLFLVLFSVGWYLAAAKRFAVHVAKVAAHVSRQITGWLTPGGSVAAQGFAPPTPSDAEFAELYQVLDQTIRKVNSLRKEDVLVKRLLNVPFLLINRNKQAIFCNSALSILAKVRAPEEMGPVNYSNIIRLTDAQGNPLDPVERCLAETKEVSQLALLRVGSDGIAVHVVCTPVLGADHQTEYVMVHIRDLREENRRAEAELDRQLETVRGALEEMKEGKIPSDAPAWVRSPAAECVKTLKRAALEHQEKEGTLSGQVQTLWQRMSRESDLKKSVHKRMEQVRSEIEGLRSQLAELQEKADRVVDRIGQVENRARGLNAEYDGIRRMGMKVLGDLKESQALVSSCLERLGSAETITRQVRAQEQMMRSLLEKSSVLNANNSILGAKIGTRRELTPADLAAITENVGQLIAQFQRGYHFIENSVGEMEKNFKELAAKLEAELASCMRLAVTDQSMIDKVRAVEKMVSVNQAELDGLARELATVKSAALRVTHQFESVEGTAEKLVQIGQASVALQAQLETGFKGVFDYVAHAEGGMPSSSAPGASRSSG